MYLYCVYSCLASTNWVKVGTQITKCFSAASIMQRSVVGLPYGDMERRMLSPNRGRSDALEGDSAHPSKNVSLRDSSGSRSHLDCDADAANTFQTNMISFITFGCDILDWLHSMWNTARRLFAIKPRALWYALVCLTRHMVWYSAVV